MSDKKYLLIKRGVFYRPDNAGYTTMKHLAGRYYQTDAEPGNGVHAIHEDLIGPLSPGAAFEDRMVYRIYQLKKELKDNGIDIPTVPWVDPYGAE